MVSNSPLKDSALEDLDSKREPSNSKAPHTCLNGETNLYNTEEPWTHEEHCALLIKTFQFYIFVPLYFKLKD